jgi:hypothetical protein
MRSCQGCIVCLAEFDGLRLRQDPRSAYCAVGKSPRFAMWIGSALGCYVDSVLIPLAKPKRQTKLESITWGPFGQRQQALRPLEGRRWNALPFFFAGTEMDCGVVGDLSSNPNGPTNLRIYVDCRITEDDEDSWVKGSKRWMFWQRVCAAWRIFVRQRCGQRRWGYMSYGSMESGSVMKYSSRGGRVIVNASITGNMM